MKPDALNLKMDELLHSQGFGEELKAASNDDSDAQCLLAEAWEKGGDARRDLPVSLEQAIRWYSASAESRYATECPEWREDMIRCRDRALKMIKGETMVNIIADVALQDNTDERTPLVLVLDCSGSMEGDRMAALNAGLVTLEAAMKNDPTTSTRGRVLVIQFGGDDEVSQGVWQDALEFSAPTLEANGRTPTGSAIMSALDAIEAQKAELKAAGIAYKRPILMLMSDGDPTDEWENAAEACRAAEAANKATVFAIGIGDDANLDVLGRFSSKGAVRIKGLEFKALFVWLSASIKAVSQTRKGDTAQLSPITSWASIGTS